MVKQSKYKGYENKRVNEVSEFKVLVDSQNYLITKFEREKRECKSKRGYYYSYKLQLENSVWISTQTFNKYVKRGFFSKQLVKKVKDSKVVKVVDFENSNLPFIEVPKVEVEKPTTSIQVMKKQEILMAMENEKDTGNVVKVETVYDSEQEKLEAEFEEQQRIEQQTQGLNEVEKEQYFKAYTFGKKFIVYCLSHEIPVYSNSVEDFITKVKEIYDTLDNYDSVGYSTGLKFAWQDFPVYECTDLLWKRIRTRWQFKKVDDIYGFSKATDIRELKSIYRKCCQTLHPDKGGNTKDFVEMQVNYESALARFC